MVESLAIMGDVSAGMRDEMAEAAKHVAKTTTFSATEAAQSYYYLASAGLNAQQSIAALPQVAKFAQAGMFDMARATDLATDAQSALGLAVDDAGQNLVNMTRVTDVLVGAAAIANASVEEFSESLTNKAGAALKELGKDIEEGVAVLAAFADQGTKGAEAGTAFGIVLRDLQTKALKNKEEFAALGVAVYDADEEMRNIADIIGDLERALDGMSDAQRKATLLQLGFADKSVAYIQTVLGQSDAIRAYEVQLRSAGGTTEEVASKQLESFKAQLKLTTDTLGVTILTLVETVVPMLGLKGGLVDVRAALEDAEWWVKSNEDAIASWVNVVAKSVALVVQIFDLFGTTIVNTFKLVGNILGNVGALIVGIFTFDLNLVTTALSELKDNVVADTQVIRDELTETAESFIALAEAIAGVQGAQRTGGGGGGAGGGGGGAGGGGGGGGGAVQMPGVAVTGQAPGIPGGFVFDLGGVHAAMEGFGKLVSVETWLMCGEMADAIESGLEQTLGDAIANGLTAAFDTGSLKSFFVEFGKTLLAGFGDILVQLGQILIQYGITMVGLVPFLTNIFTAGPAAIAAGAALIALGSAFSSISSGGGGVGRGTATSGAFREPSFGPQMADVSRRTINMGAAPTVQPQPVVNNYVTVIGPDDPTAQRQLTELLVKAQRRGLVLVT